jgi:hypothetical protein
MSDPREVRLRDVTWGGRIRRAYQGKVLAIARRAARSRSGAVHGSMVFSTHTAIYEFLDGGLRETRGEFGPRSGMCVYGELAMIHVLYELGLSPQALLRRKKLPSKGELRERVRLEAESAKAEREGAAADRARGGER